MHGGVELTVKDPRVNGRRLDTGLSDGSIQLSALVEVVFGWTVFCKAAK